MWKFLVKNQSIEILEREVLADHQIQYVQFKFTFDGDWKKFHKVVQFSQCDEIYSIVLGFDGTTCYLPAELHVGAVKMSVFGYDAASDTTETRCITMFYCGIDIAKYKHEASVIDMNGKALIDSISFSNDKQGCEKVLAIFEKFEVSTDDVVIGMEATGHYWLSVYTFFLELGYTVKVINPIQSEAFRKMYIRQTKNDSKDSYIIAQIMRFGEYSETSLSEENIIALRQLSRYRLALVDACGDCKRRVIALLDQVFPEYDKLFSDTFGNSSTELLLNCPTPEDMLAVSTRKLTNILTKASHGRFGKEKADELKAAAKNTFGIAFAKNAFSFQIKQLMQQIVFLENQLSELEEQISNLLH